jgi:uncharacterized membrane protein YdfJ with MMPL/SSD domain
VPTPRGKADTLRRVGEITYLRAGTIVIVAAALLAAALPLSAGIFDKVEPFDISDPGSEVERAYAAYEDAEGTRPDPEVVLLADAGAVATATTDLEAVDGVALVVGPSADPALNSTDGSSALVLGFTEAGSNRVEIGERVEAAFAAEDDGVLAGGTAVAAYEIGEQTEDDTRRIELFAAPVLLLVLLAVFRSPVAAALPLILSGFSILITLALLSLLTGVVDIDVFSLQVVTGLGVGLAIDYSLFVLARYRIEMRRDEGYRNAHVTTTLTAGRAVLFGALTVAAALAALIAFPQQFLSSTGIAGALVAILSGVAALFVLPALLALLGPRVDPGWERAADRTAPEPDPLSGGSEFWTTVSHRVMAHPFPWATAALIAMLAIAAPTLGGSVTTPDARALPESAGARQVADRAAAEFENGNPTRLGVWVPSGAGPAEVQRATKGIGGEKGSQTSVEPPRKLRDGSLYVGIVSPLDPLSDEGQDLVEEVRDAPFPEGSLVGGRAAELTDQRTSIASNAPLVVAIVVITNLLLVLLMVRSVVLPLVSIALNALTVLAAYGLMVAAFQSETVAELLGAGVQEGIDVSVPVLAFAVVFGLSTDYGIFVFSRIAEARRSGMDEADAITAGISRTGRLITSAAVIFAIAVGANVFSDLVIVKEFALAVAIAVILDATIVRGVLVPSILRMLGRRAWWPGSDLRNRVAR